MKNRKTIYVLIGVIVVVAAAGAAYWVMRPGAHKPFDNAAPTDNPSAGLPSAPGSPSPQPGNANAPTERAGHG